MDDWYEGFDETDELMLIFPFGRLYKQINDGRYAKLLNFFHGRMPKAQFRRNITKLYQKFVREFLEFNENFDKFTENREDNHFKMTFPKLSYDSFSVYKFKSNSWIEEVCENFFSLVLPFVGLDVLVNKNETLIDVILRLYKGFYQLWVYEDLTDQVNDRDIVTVYRATQGRGSRKTGIKFTKNIFMARILIRIVAACFNLRPRFAIDFEMSKFVKIIRILADWTKYFTNECPEICPLYYTEFMLRAKEYECAIQKSEKAMQSFSQGSDLDALLPLLLQTWSFH